MLPVQLVGDILARCANSLNTSNIRRLLPGELSYAPHAYSTTRGFPDRCLGRHVTCVFAHSFQAGMCYPAPA